LDAQNAVVLLRLLKLFEEHLTVSQQLLRLLKLLDAQEVLLRLLKLFEDHFTVSQQLLRLLKLLEDQKAVLLVL
jgi:hypothetical protein